MCTCIYIIMDYTIMAIVMIARGLKYNKLLGYSLPY